MRVLVIGGTNFIGPPLVRRLVELGQDVAVFHRGQTSAELPTGVTQIFGDRHRLSEQTAAFRRLGPHIVLDMIAYTEADARSLVETFRGLAERTVIISSGDVYRAYGRFIGLEGGPIEPTPLPEDAPLRSVLFPYRSRAKGPDEFLHFYDKIPVERAVMSELVLRGTVLRLPMTYGPGDPFRRLSAYLKRMEDGRPAILLDENLARWKPPRGQVENVAVAIALAVVDERAARRIYNVAEPVALTEADWVRKIGELVGWQGVIVQAPPGRIPIPYHVEQSLDMDSIRIRRELDYAEPVTLDVGLARTIAWERTNPPEQLPGIGLVDYATEDALLAELRPESAP
jgi:nucleoside-diphosphate-sugar epimerase